MPHVSSSGGDDLGSTDEVKVYKDEGIDEDEKRSSENLTEEKSSLIDLTESEVRFLPTCENTQNKTEYLPIIVNIINTLSFVFLEFLASTRSFRMSRRRKPTRRAAPGIVSGLNL